MTDMHAHFKAPVNSDGEGLSVRSIFLNINNNTFLSSNLANTSTHRAPWQAQESLKMPKSDDPSSYAFPGAVAIVSIVLLQYVLSASLRSVRNDPLHLRRKVREH